MRPLWRTPPPSTDAGSGEQLAETMRRLHHGGVPCEQIGEPVRMLQWGCREWHINRGSPEHTRLLEQGATEVKEGLDLPVSRQR